MSQKKIKRSKSEKPRLTGRDLKILEEILKGKDLAEISKDLNITDIEMLKGVFNLYEKVKPTMESEK